MSHAVIQLLLFSLHPTISLVYTKHNIHKHTYTSCFTFVQCTQPHVHFSFSRLRNRPMRIIPRLRCQPLCSFIKEMNPIRLHIFISWKTIHSSVNRLFSPNWGQKKISILKPAYHFNPPYVTTQVLLVPLKFMGGEYLNESRKVIY